MLPPVLVTPEGRGAQATHRMSPLTLRCARPDAESLRPRPAPSSPDLSGTGSASRASPQPLPAPTHYAPTSAPCGSQSTGGARLAGAWGGVRVSEEAAPSHKP